jgi:hypothetical protein
MVEQPLLIAAILSAKLPGFEEQQKWIARIDRMLKAANNQPHHEGDGKRHHSPLERSFDCRPAKTRSHKEHSGVAHRRSVVTFQVSLRTAKASSGLL